LFFPDKLATWRSNVQLKSINLFPTFIDSVLNYCISFCILLSVLMSTSFNCESNCGEKMFLCSKSNPIIAEISTNYDSATINRCDYYTLSLKSVWKVVMRGVLKLGGGELRQRLRPTEYYSSCLICFFFGAPNSRRSAYSSWICVIL
jgi:hypothetical protein